MVNSTHFNRRDFIKTMTAAAAAVAFCPTHSSSKSQKQLSGQRPNILLIVSDDQGYGDSSCYFHPKEIDTPNIDRLSQLGIRMSNGYASACVCAPTRAGLLTGRYQERFGFYTAPHSRIGMPLDEITLADILKKHGYVTGIFGKWHLGIKPDYHPLERGFDEFYGFLGHGAHDYFDLTPKPNEEFNAIYRNKEIISDTGYLTDNLAREAIAFINAHKDEPYFCYLPFNAVHWPLQAPEDEIRLFNTGDETRDINLAMLKKMDEAIGKVLDTVESTGKLDNTLIIFFSDNGGAKNIHANNGKLRDYKQSLYEGGIRVPFIVSWPRQLQQGAVCDEPIICCDILPTVCAAINTELQPDRVYDGKNILPALKGELNEPLHEYLYWDDGSVQWAVRKGEWKLLQNRNKHIELYNLEKDLSENQDVSAEYPDLVKQLQDAYNRWRSSMGESLREKRSNTNKNEREERRANRPKRLRE